LALEVPDRDREKLQRLKENLDWFESNYKSFEKDFKNQYVAVKDKRFLDNDISLDILVKRLNLKNYNDSIAIDFVYNWKEPPTTLVFVL
jgi:hypothetical protein